MRISFRHLASAQLAFAALAFTTTAWADGSGLAPWVSAGGAVGSAGSTRGEAVYWTPLWQSQSAVGFIDFRGKVFDGGYLEGNVALGVRAMLPEGYNFGIWGGYDARRSGVSGNVFQQLSGGLELLGDRAAFRANGYVPLSGAAAGGSPTVFLSGNDILMSGGLETPLYGVDGEAGARLFASGGPGAPQQELWAYAGGYWFDNAGVNAAIAGPRARLEWQVNDVFSPLPGSRLTFGAAVRHDTVRDTAFEASASLRIPLGGAATTDSSSGQFRRLADPLVRDTDIVVEGTTEHVEDAITGVDFDRAVTVADAASLQGAINGAGGNSLIIANGNGIGQWTLMDSQTLLGGGGTLSVRGLTSGTVADFTAAGTRPVLQEVANDYYVTQSVLIANNNTHIAGMEIDSVGKSLPDDYSDIIAATADIYAGSGLHNIAVTGNLLKTSVDFNNPGGGIFHASNGVFFDTVSGSVVQDNEIYASGLTSYGVALDQVGSSSNRVDNNVIHVSAGNGVGIFMSGTGGGARNNQIDINGDSTRGIVLSTVTDLVADRNTVTINGGIDDWGFVFNSATRSVLDRNTVTSAASLNSTAIYADLGSQSTIRNNTLTGGQSGITLRTGSDQLAIVGNTFTIDGNAINLRGGSYRIADNVFTGYINGNVVQFPSSVSAQVLADSTGNSIAAGTTGIVKICGGPGFTGTWSIMDNRPPAALDTYTDSCSSP
jgi:hypothetical protein